MDKNNQLETAPIGKLVFKLAIPTVMAQLVNLLYNIVDRIYVGRIPEIGSLSLAGLGVTFPIILLVSAFAMLAGMGGASRAAVSMGEKDNDKAEKILGNCTMLLIIFSVVLAVVFMLTKNQILMKFGASEATLPYASDYISIYLVGTIFVQIALGLNLFITNQGFAKTSMMTVCIGAVLNIVLDPIFIYVFGMGVKGAALATIISQGVSCLWVLKFLTGKKTVLKIRLKNLALDGKIVTSVLSLGVSPFIMQATECLIQLTFNNGMLKYGNDLYVALMSILFSLTQLIWMPLNGFSQGAQPVIGYNYGAKRFDRIRQGIRASLLIAAIWSVAVFIICHTVEGALIRFVASTTDAEVIYWGSMYLKVDMSFIIVCGVIVILRNSMQGFGDRVIPVFSSCIELAGKIIFAFVFAPVFAYWGIIWAEPVVWIAMVIPLIVKVVHTLKKEI